MRKIQASIVIIDDQPDILLSAKMLLKKHFETVATLSEPKECVSYLSENKVDVLLLDMNYRIGYEDGREGIYFLKEIKKLSPDTVVLLMTAFGKVETAVEGLKSGASDYILKPWDNDKLVETVKKAVQEHRKNRSESGNKPSETEIFFKGNSKTAEKAYLLAEKVARTDANVLILGENGTGKYVMARYIHDNSLRKSKPFVHVDLGSLSSQLFESELFGYAKGAFTDAKTDTQGRFEAADGGTLFLDEIANVPLHLQSKLLQAIQSKSVIRLGEIRPRPLDVRIITATNASLEKEVISGNFRQDLFYRINTMEIILPPLRERKDDLLPMADFFLQKMTAKYEREAIRFSEEALMQIAEYQWKGNVREMGNRIERAVILCNGELVTPDDLDLPLDLPTLPDTGILSDLEKNTIEKALADNAHNISKTAQALGISRPALYRRMEKYGIKE
ncbi:MAG: sigma-54 dependent transcriptional regulator [Capnocytophaga sp.]|nr:sigma-54 dependent transcriptional regulator [Capnocytophaga sp.]